MNRSRFLDLFIDAVHKKQKVVVWFVHTGSSSQVSTLCAPMDYGPKRREKMPVERFHFWDYEGDPEPHTLSIEEHRLVKLVVLEETFDPGEFVAWSTDWHIPRDWGPFS